MAIASSLSTLVGSRIRPWNGLGVFGSCIGARGSFAAAIEETLEQTQPLDDTQVDVYGWTSHWGDVQRGPEDPIIGLLDAFQRDTHPRKLSLSVGAYRDGAGQPYYLRCVREAERRILEDPLESKEYPGIAGLAQFNAANDRLLFGPDSEVLASGRCATVQCVSGSGALRVGAEFIARHHPVKGVLLPSPSWSNHYVLFPDSRLMMQPYPYYDPHTKGFNMGGMLTTLANLPPATPVVLQVAAHNPTGVDPTPEQWEEIVHVCTQRRLLPFLDNAYMGFATGSLARDAVPLRLFAASGLEFLVANSYSKNMGLYAERAGALTVVCGSQHVAGHVASQLKALVRPMYSMPPKHGAAVVQRVLEDPALSSLWGVELRDMAGRVAGMRRALRDALEARAVPGDWGFLTEQVGMFSYTGFTPAQVAYLRDRWHVYIVASGRVSISGLTMDNLDYMADAVADMVRNGPR